MQATLVQDIDQVFNLDMFRETDLVMNKGFFIVLYQDEDIDLVVNL